MVELPGRADDARQRDPMHVQMNAGAHGGDIMDAGPAVDETGYLASISGRTSGDVPYYDMDEADDDGRIADADEP